MEINIEDYINESEMKRIVENEFQEDGICTWNMFTMITEVFELEDDDYVNDVFWKLQKRLTEYKEIDEAYENLELGGVLSERKQ